MEIDFTTRIIRNKKNIALVAHDNCKKTLLGWVETNKSILAQHNLFATGTSGHLISEKTGVEVTCMLSGPLGGDLQLGALISEGKIDVLIFFWDPLCANPHDPDVKALLRIAAVWNIIVAQNKSTADFIISSPMFHTESSIDIPDYNKYLKDRLKPTVCPENQ